MHLLLSLTASMPRSIIPLLEMSYACQSQNPLDATRIVCDWCRSCFYSKEISQAFAIVGISTVLHGDEQAPNLLLSVGISGCICIRLQAFSSNPFSEALFDLERLSEIGLLVVPGVRYFVGDLL